MNITKRIEFDAGHRIPSHKSKCRNFHGHRWVLECTLVGPVHPVRGESDDGMILDFSDIKAVMNRCVGDPWDHGFLVWVDDHKALSALALLGDDHRTVILDCIPTSENLAQLAFDILDKEFRVIYRGDALELERVRLYETPNGWADATSPSIAR